MIPDCHCPKCRWRSALATVLGALVCSCVGTDVGNPEDAPPDDEKVEAEVRFEGVEEPPPVDALMLGGGTRLEEAWIVADRFGLRPSGACDRRAESRTDEPVAVDLLSESSESVARLGALSAGEYCGMDLQLERLPEQSRPDQAPAELSGDTVMLLGERADGVEFRLSADVEAELELTSLNGNFALDGDRRRFVLVAALQRWIDEKELDEIDGETPILIDKGHHEKIYREFRLALDETLRLYRDGNANGRLDPSERADVLVSNLPEEGDSGDSDDDHDAGMELEDASGN